MQFQVSIAVLPIATLTRNFAKLVRNPHGSEEGRSASAADCRSVPLAQEFA